VNRIYALSRKELLHMVRDPLSLGILLVIPLLFLLFFGYAITVDIEAIPLVIVNRDAGPLGEDLAKDLEASETFDVVGFVREEEARRWLAEGRVKVAALIRANFSKRLENPRKVHGARVTFLIDGSDLFVALKARASANRITYAYSAKVAARLLKKKKLVNVYWMEREPLVAPALHVKFNPGLRSESYLVPGLIGLILTHLCLVLTSLSMVREREGRTLEILFALRVRPMELITGKMAPYLLLSLVIVAAILVTGTTFFDLPVSAGPLPVISSSVLYTVGILGLGLFLSVVVRNTRQAVTMAFLLTLPFILLSGFLFPISQMPEAVQGVAALIPLTHYYTILRECLLKGSELGRLWREMAVLGAFALLGPFGCYLCLRRRRPPA
jgi:ABC-2 type transport system permease protein